jgi:hypothetical protein
MKVLQFKPRPEPKELTKIELMYISRRVDEINEILDLCGDNDQDVIDNLDRELEHIEATLEDALKIAQERERKQS